MGTKKTGHAGHVAIVLALVGVCALGGAFAACGGDDQTNAGADDGGNGDDSTTDDGGDGNGNGDGNNGDGSNGDGNNVGDGGVVDAPSIDGSPWNDGGSGCLNPGSACKTGSDCCSNTCVNGVCDFPPCVSVGGACSQNAQCCTLTCTGGTCASLGSGCTTLGNTCTQNSDCCSNRCSGGTCQPSSWCGQQGDICAQNGDCCSGYCQMINNSVGICGPPPKGASNCGLPDGYLCAGSAPDGGVVLQDGGVPTCGGPCCSRSCAPWGPTGTLVCQPASGCHVVGDLCLADIDCCGAKGLPGPMPQGGYSTCDFSGTADGGIYGICRNPTGCKPNGDVCKLHGTTCNSSCDCCAGNCNQQVNGEYPCKQDNMGVPRCTNTQCVDAGIGCSTSADCCNGMPCVPNPIDGGQPPFICDNVNCQPNCAKCTNTADCCPGETCTNGICDPCGTPDGGPPPPPPDAGNWDGSIPDGGCSQYGQLCTTSADCCNGVPCINGTCHYLQ